MATKYESHTKYTNSLKFMENFENQPRNLDEDKKGLILKIEKLEETKIIKLAKTLEYNKVEGPEEALKFVIESIKGAKDQDDFQTIQRKYNNLDEIEV